MHGAPVAAKRIGRQIGERAAQDLRQRRVERKRQTVQVEHVCPPLGEGNGMHDAGPDKHDIAIDPPSIAFQPQRACSPRQHAGDRIRVRREFSAGHRQQRIEKGRARISHRRNHPAHLHRAQEAGRDDGRRARQACAGYRLIPALAKAASACLPFM